MGVLTRGGGLLVKLITLRLSVFEIFAVKWPKFGIWGYKAQALSTKQG